MLNCRPVPPGFIITTEVCTYYYEHDKNYPKKLEGDIQNGMHHIEGIVGKKLGDESDPLLVCVRSGTRVSMPCMMDTIFNLGLNDKTEVGLHTKLEMKDLLMIYTDDLFIQMFGDIVLGVPHVEFEKVLKGVKTKVGAKLYTELKTEDLKQVFMDIKNE